MICIEENSLKQLLNDSRNKETKVWAYKVKCIVIFIARRLSFYVDKAVKHGEAIKNE